MSPALSDYVRTALAEGRSPDDIRGALDAAGWKPSEITQALNAWAVQDGPSGGTVVPRPIRSNAARDALFYAMLFVCFAVISSNVLTLAFMQLNLWLPEPGDSRNYSRFAEVLRWCMAALIVFAPAFGWLDRSDRRATLSDPARQHGAVRRWLSALALLGAVLTLMGDALFLIYTWLDGQMSLRFALKSLVVGIMALLTLAYFRNDRGIPLPRLPIPAAWPLLGLAALMVGLSLWAVGGPDRGQMERRDQARLDDLRRISGLVPNCIGKDAPLPDSLEPLDCVNDLDTLRSTGATFTYAKLAEDRFEICTEVEFPRGLPTYVQDRIDGTTLCEDRTVRR